MKDVRQVVLGVLAALFSSVILLGSLTLSLAEGGLLVALVPSSTSTLAPTPTDSPTPPPPPPTTRPGEPTYTPSPTPLPTATPTDSPTPTPLPTASNCPQPDDWKSILVPLGATLYSLADTYGVTPKVMANYNCLPLTTMELHAGSTIYVPKRILTPTPACGPYPWWVHTYIIQPGDTLSRLSQIFGVTVDELQFANCLGNSTRINVGQLFWVPFIPTRVPSRTPARTPTPVPPRTSTPTNLPACKSNRYAHQPADAYAPANDYTDKPTWTDQYSYPYACAHRHAYGYSDPVSDACPDGHPGSHRHACPDGHPGSYRYARTYRYASADRYASAHGYTSTYMNTHSWHGPCTCIIEGQDAQPKTMPGY